MINNNNKFKTLRPKKNQIDFFIADEIEIQSIRDEIASMEHPFFALKSGDTRIREYVNGNTKVTIKPTADGIATIFDKDIWIYCISKLQHAINNYDPINRTIYFTPYDFFVISNRAYGGTAYKELEKALSRLKGTVIKTNIVYSEDKQEIIEFGLIDSWRILEEKKGKLDIGMVEVTLPDWLFDAIKKTKILKISPDYFRIRKAIDRRIYEIARKHCGNKLEFEISLDKLFLKTGSSSTKEKFKFNLKLLIKKNDLPDYEIFLKSNDNVVFRNKNLTDEQIKREKNRDLGKKRLYQIKRDLIDANKK